MRRILNTLAAVSLAVTAVLGSAAAASAGEPLVGADLDNTPAADSGDCVRADGTREFVYVNYPNGTRLVTVGQVLVGTVAGCVSR